MVDGKCEDFVVEAANNSIFSIYFEDVNACETISGLLKLVADKIEEFDADEEFNELKSPSFGEWNKFTSSEFLKMLQADENQFKKAASDIRKYLLEQK